MIPLLFLAAATATPGAPPPPTDRGAACAALAKTDPAKAELEAKAWRDSGGGNAARQCLGLALAARGDWSNAATAFEQAARDAMLKIDRTATILWMQAGNAALAGDEPVRARTDLDNALKLEGLTDEMKGEVYLDRARAGVAANDLVGARADLEQATKLVSRDPLAWLLRATLARREKDLPGALAAIREAAKLAPDEPAIAYEAGNIAAAQGQIEDARAAWTRAAKLAPDSDAGQAAELALKGGDTAPNP